MSAASLNLQLLMSTSKTFLIEHGGVTFRVECYYHKTWFRDSFYVFNECSETFERARTIDVPDAVIIATTKRIRALNNIKK